MSHLALMWHTPEHQQILQEIDGEFQALVNTAIEEGRLSLPPIPEVVIRIHKICQADDSTIRDIANALVDDPSLTAYVIRAANSVIFSPRNVTCHDLITAVSRLGMYRVRDIVTAQAIEELKRSATFSQECNRLLEESAHQSRLLAGATTLVCNGVLKHSEHKLLLEPEKALLACLLSDIGLFSLIKEYEYYLEKGNYLDFNIAKQVFAQGCNEASTQILKHWGFDEDYLEVAGNDYYTPKSGEETRYVDLARMANHLLLFRNQDDAYYDSEIELDLAGAETMYELSNLSDSEFSHLVQEIIQNSGL
ncbi:HDOD domain-containing protein [Thaumasiovibrio subtropicus]|uniref:HDOD domain-containing protein n=1 Tax=Thaumasiovibrio subtropicus TaxID=1891207 RepID=UPI000B3540AC|nr:HDOD domain-containing protein [Thaumasiovibrio subtropicus]